LCLVWRNPAVIIIYLAYVVKGGQPIVTLRYRILDELEQEPFSEAYWIKYQSIENARLASVFSRLSVIDDLFEARPKDNSTTSSSMVSIYD
jgi:hypothetical protein